MRRGQLRGTDWVMIIIAIGVMSLAAGMNSSNKYDAAQNEKFLYLYDNGGTSDSVEYQTWLIKHDASTKIKELDDKAELKILELNKK